MPDRRPDDLMPLADLAQLTDDTMRYVQRGTGVPPNYGGFTVDELRTTCDLHVTESTRVPPGQYVLDVASMTLTVGDLPRFDADLHVARVRMQCTQIARRAGVPIRLAVDARTAEHRAQLDELRHRPSSTLFVRPAPRGGVLGYQVSCRYHRPVTDVGLDLWRVTRRAAVDLAVDHIERAHGDANTILVYRPDGTTNEVTYVSRSTRGHWGM